MGNFRTAVFKWRCLCNELEFTVDSESAAKVIYNCPKVSLLTAQCTQDAVYHLEDLEEMLDMNSNFMRYRPILKDYRRKTKDYGNRPVFIN